MPDKKHDPKQHTNIGARDGIDPGVVSRRTAEERARHDAVGTKIEQERKTGQPRSKFATPSKREGKSLPLPTSGVGVRIDLPHGRVVRTATMPEVPVDIIKMRLFAETSCLKLFGIPPSMIQTETANGRSASNESAERMWVVQLRVMKERTRRMLSDVVRFTTDMPRMMEAVRIHGSAVTQEILARAREFKIIIPGIPAEEKLTTYYEQGLLSYKGYKKYISANNAISEDDMNEKADPPQLVFIPEDTGEGGGGGGGKAKKPKTATKKNKNKAKKEKQKKKKKESGKGAGKKKS